MDRQWIYETGKILDATVLASLILSFSALLMYSKFRIDLSGYIIAAFFLVSYVGRLLLGFEVMMRHSFIVPALTICNNLIWIALCFFMFEVKVISMRLTILEPTQLKKEFDAFKVRRNLIYLFLIFFQTFGQFSIAFIRS
jgi:hypothetical protein